MDKKTAEKEIERLTSEAKSLIEKAEKLADEFGIQFYFSVEYGMDVQSKLWNCWSSI